MDNIIIFGGTFDPIHNGHIFMANQCIDKLSADKLIFVPAGIPPHKNLSYNSASSHHRINMCKLSAFINQRFEVSDIEVKRSGISYTIDTLRVIKDEYKNANIFLLIGQDMMVTFDKWRSPEEICKIATLCVVPRICNKFDDINKKIDFLYDIEHLDIPYIDVSSTMVRERISQGKEISDLVPRSVSYYIKKNSLYKSLNKGSDIFYVE